MIDPMYVHIKRHWREYRESLQTSHSMVLTLMMGQEWFDPFVMAIGRHTIAQVRNGTWR